MKVFELDIAKDKSTGKAEFLKLFSDEDLCAFLNDPQWQSFFSQAVVSDYLEKATVEALARFKKMVKSRAAEKAECLSWRETTSVEKTAVIEDICLEAEQIGSLVEMFEDGSDRDDGYVQCNAVYEELERRLECVESISNEDLCMLSDFNKRLHHCYYELKNVLCAAETELFARHLKEMGCVVFGIIEIYNLKNGSADNYENAPPPEIEPSAQPSVEQASRLCLNTEPAGVLLKMYEDADDGQAKRECLQELKRRLEIGSVNDAELCILSKFKRRRYSCYLELGDVLFEAEAELYARYEKFLKYLVYQVLKKHGLKNSSIEECDLLQTAAVAFFDIVDRFEPELGFELSTFAWKAVCKRVLAATHDSGIRKDHKFLPVVSLEQYLDDLGKKCGNDVIVELADPICPVEKMEEFDRSSFLRRKIQEAMEPLSKKQRELLRLIYWVEEGRTEEDFGDGILLPAAAKAMAIPEHEARTLHQQALNVLGCRLGWDFPRRLELGYVQI